MQERPEGGSVDCVGKIGIREDKERVRAAKLEQDALQLPAASLREAAAGLRRAGEVDATDRRMLDEHVGDAGRLTRCVRDDAECPGRQSRLGEDLAPERAARHRRPLGRLEHDRVAVRERGSDRAQREDQRRIPRRDRTDDANGLAQSHRHRSGHIGWDHLADRGVGHGCRLSQQAGRENGLEHPEPECAARLAGEQAHNLVPAALEDVSRPQEYLLAYRRRCRRPFRERGGRACDSALGVRARARGSPNDDVPGVGITDVERGAVRGVRPLAGDEEP